MAITNNKFVDSWIDEMTAMVQPDKIVLITGGRTSSRLSARKHARPAR